MPELRWILLGAGILLVAGLWWWETRRAARAARDPADRDAGQRPEPSGETEERHRMEASLAGDQAAGDEQAPGFPEIRASRRRPGAAGRSPPVVDIPAGVEPELARGEARVETPRVSYRAMRDRLDDMPADLKNLPPDQASEAEQRLPWVRTQPLDRDEIMGRKNRVADAEPASIEPEADAESGAAPDDDAPSDREQAARRQRIVALRLVAHAGRWAGRELVAALEAEGLTYGKYSIFHRERDDGKAIFYVASMIEPGSFDLDGIDALSFPGVSIFAVIPGPLDAPATFDMMLATARRLVERLTGHLQDEQGSTLTAQRILNLREELVHFEHVTQRLGKR